MRTSGYVGVMDPVIDPIFSLSFCKNDLYFISVYEMDRMSNNYWMGLLFLVLTCVRMSMFHVSCHPGKDRGTCIG